MRLMQKRVSRGGDWTQMPERVDRYRLNAEKCYELAQNFKDPEAKRTMLAMADAWLMLAAQRVKNVEPLLNKPPPSGTNRAREA
jgi:hypothetical protein